jgi:hypothetical protein
MMHLRDTAAGELVLAEKKGRVLLHNSLTETERIRLQACLNSHINKALRCLEAAGAQTDPSE